MDPSKRQELERRIHALCTRGENGRAVELALQGYGPEFMRLLSLLLRSPERVQEAYSLFSEALLVDLPSFRWESSFRTWAYRVARHVAYRLASSPAARREVLVGPGAFEQEPSPERSRTLPWLRTEVKEGFRELRSRLEPQQQRLLELRVEQELPWREVARAMAAPGEPLSPQALDRKAAVLRQQFQHIKLRLRELAREESLLSHESAPG